MQKLSFGFKKVIKAQPKQDETKQFIDCLEGKSIKVKGGEVSEEKKPLVIPLKPNDKTVTAAALLRIAQEVENGIQIDETQNANKKDEYQPLPIPENESLEAKAARELLEEARKVERANKEAESNLVVPIAKPPTLTGEKESTLDDYESIPIAEFGMAMLRGMGWTPGKGLGKHPAVSLQIPNLRPKGMGLGADKTILKQLNGANGEIKASEEELKIVKGAYVKFTSGKHTGSYGQVTGFDEDSGRIIVKTALSGENLTVNEFMVTAVNKNEYQKCSKVLNSAKYDEYKKRDETRHEKVKSEHISSREPSKEYKHSNTDSKYSSQKYSDNREDSRHSRTSVRNDSHKKHSDSNYDSNHDRRHREDKSHRDKKYERKYTSSSSDSDEKPSRDKKRKGKKKRRDRSRSRNRRH